jgi:hypothetical protein
MVVELLLVVSRSTAQTHVHFADSKIRIVYLPNSKENGGADPAGADDIFASGCSSEMIDIPCRGLIALPETNLYVCYMKRQTERNENSKVLRS